MTKTSKIELSIPKPCNEDWENMSSAEKGRHCTSCNKTVVDFSLFSDREIIEFFKQANGRVCGRFAKQQIAAPIVVLEHNNRPLLYKMFLGTALASWLGLASTANAQTKYTPKPVSQNNAGQTKDTNDSKHANSVKTRQIKGSVISSKTHKPIGFVTVILKSADSQTPIDTALTDANGKFTIHIPDEFADKKLVLVSSAPMWYSQVTEYTPGKKPLLIKMEEEEVFLKGDVMYIPPDSAKHKH